MALTISGSGGGITASEVQAMIGWQTIYSKNFSASDWSTSVRSSYTYQDINIGSPSIANLISGYSDARIRVHVDSMEYSAYSTADYSDRTVAMSLGTMSSVPGWVTLPTPNIKPSSHNIITNEDVICIYLKRAYENYESSGGWYYGDTSASSIIAINKLRLAYKYFKLYSLSGTFYVEVR